MAIMRDIGAGCGGKPNAEAILRCMQAGSDGEMPAIITHRCIPGGGACRADIKPDAVIDDAPQRQRGIFEATFLTQGADADGEAFHLADFHLAGIKITQHQADISFILPIGYAGADNANAHIKLGGIAHGAAITNSKCGMPGRPGIKQAAAHDQPCGAATQQQRLAGAVAAFANFQKPPGNNCGIHGGLQRGTIIGNTIAKRAEIPH